MHTVKVQYLTQFCSGLVLTVGPVCQEALSPCKCPQNTA